MCTLCSITKITSLFVLLQIFKVNSLLVILSLFYEVVSEFTCTIFLVGRGTTLMILLLHIFCLLFKAVSRFTCKQFYEVVSIVRSWQNAHITNNCIKHVLDPTGMFDLPCQTYLRTYIQTCMPHKYARTTSGFLVNHSATKRK